MKSLFPPAVLRVAMAAIATSVCPAATLHVPKDHATIQAAIDAAKNGDTMRVAPGSYREKLVIRGKNITLASEYAGGTDRSAIGRTILQGGSTDGKKGTGAILTIDRDVGFQTRIVGFTFFQGDHGIIRGRAQVLDNRFIENRDRVSLESGGAAIRGNVIAVATTASTWTARATR